MRVATEEDDGGEQQVYLGAVVISSYDKVVVPFFEKATDRIRTHRSVQTVADDSRYTVGVIQTDADLMGQRVENHLRTQEAIQCGCGPLASPIDPSGFDVLLAAMSQPP